MSLAFYFGCILGCAQCSIRREQQICIKSSTACVPGLAAHSAGLRCDAACPCSHVGYDDESTQEMMRLYQTIHTDHEV